MNTIEYVDRHVIPAAFGLLPRQMDTPAARAMLLAIGLQESRFIYRIQVPHGPAHGFWQFESGGGVLGVLSHRATAPIVLPIIHTLRYHETVGSCYAAIADNDVLACVFARLLLWTVPAQLPRPDESDRAWNQYLYAWRPGKPHPQTWGDYFTAAWRMVTERSAHAEAE